MGGSRTIVLSLCEDFRVAKCYFTHELNSASAIWFIFLHKGTSLTLGKYATFLCIALMANCMSCKYI